MSTPTIPAAGAGMKARANEMVSLADRMGTVQGLRLAFAVIGLGALLLAPQVTGGSVTDLAFVSAGYLIVSAVAEGLRRIIRGRGLAIVGAMLLIDGVYLSWVMYSTGGTLSPLRFLFYVHLIAVTLLASYRTGLKIAMWHSLLFFVVFYAQAAGILEVREGVAGALPGSGSFNRVSIFNILMLWVIAIGTAVFSSINERELRRRRSDLETLAEMAAEFEDAKDPRGVADVLLQKTSQAFGFGRGAVLGGDEGDMRLLSFMGPGEPAKLLPGADEVVTRAWNEHEIHLAHKLDPDANPRLSSLLPFARNLVIVPLFAEGSAVGALILEHPGKRRHIERRVVAMLSQFAAHAALALKSAWLLQKVQRMADTDALTGIANRRLFEHTLDRELSRAARTGEPMTLVMLDVDHFKKLNDTYGHQAGDEVLQAVASTLQGNSRDFDVVARYGGEEFAVILPGCPSRESLVVAERLRAAVSKIETVTTITASAGVATFPTHAGDPGGLIRAADEALYESKRSGRDRVTRSRRRPRKQPLSVKL